MTDIYKILILEDSAADAGLIEIQLEELGFKSEVVITDNKKDFEEKFLTEKPSLVLSDYKIPSYSGLRALNYCKQFTKQIPFIFVTGAISPELAAETIIDGADGFVLKSRLNTLSVVIQKTIKRFTAENVKNITSSVEDLKEQIKLEHPQMSDIKRQYVQMKAKIDEQLKILDEIKSASNDVLNK
jgi:DNA-binding NtrC family response regulator